MRNCASLKKDHKKQKIEVNGFIVSIEGNDYINMTDIAKQADKTDYKSKRDNSGTFPHRYLTLAFCYSLNPEFQLYFLHEFDRLKQEEALRLENTRTFYLSKITDYVNNTRIMSDDILGQLTK